MMTTIVDALRQHHHCKKQATGPIPLHPFTREEWHVEGEQMQEVISSLEEVEAAYA